MGRRKKQNTGGDPGCRDHEQRLRSYSDVAGNRERGVERGAAERICCLMASHICFSARGFSTWDAFLYTGQNKDGLECKWGRRMTAWLSAWPSGIDISPRASRMETKRACVPASYCWRIALLGPLSSLALVFKKWKEDYYWVETRKSLKPHNSP